MSDGVFLCPMVSGDVRRVSEELLKGIFVLFMDLSLIHIQTPKTYIHFTLMFTITSSRYLGTIQDNNMLTDTNKN